MNQFFIFKASIEQGGLTEEVRLPDCISSFENVKFETFKDAIKAYLSIFDEIEKGVNIGDLQSESEVFALELQRFVYDEDCEDWDIDGIEEIGNHWMYLYTEQITDGKVAYEFNYSEEELKNLIKK